MMTLTPTPDELVLKQQVTDTLAREGVLAKIKAELRAAVFRVMHERAVPLTAGASAPKLSAFPDDVTATAIELIAECLAFFQWDHSLLVLRAEADLETKPLTVDGEKLAQRLKLEGTESVVTPSAPVLLQLVEERLAGKSASGGDESRKTMSSFGGGIQDREGSAADHHSGVKRVTSSSLSFSSIGMGQQQQERSDVLDEDEEDEKAPMEKATERVSERHGFDSDRLMRESAPENEDDESEGGGVRAGVEEPRGGAGKFVHGDDCSDDEEYTTSKLGQEDAGCHDEDKNEEEEEEELELEESMVEEIASGSEYEESRELTSPVPTARTEDEDDRNASDQDDDRAMLLPPVPTRLAPAHPLESLAPAPTAVEQEADASARDDESDSDDEAARLNSLDAKLKAMEAEDDTGTLQQLKASLQLELQRGDDGDKGGEDEDGDGYGSSDFEEEEEVASEISEEVESMAEPSDKEEEESESEREVSVVAVTAPLPVVLMDDRAVESEDALNSYDYVEDVEHPW